MEISEIRKKGAEIARLLKEMERLVALKNSIIKNNSIVQANEKYLDNVCSSIKTTKESVEKLIN
jgi:hypothetical protein